MNGLFELCRLLHKRGVKWQQVNDDGIAWADAKGTKYTARLGATFKGPDGTVTVFNMAPEQAVEATLGRGECRIVKETKTTRSTYRGEVEVTDEKCSECGGYMEVCAGVVRNYCPNCGRKVVEE